MSKVKETKVLTHSEVQKRIIENPPKVRSKEELLGPLDRYRDENFEVYNRKRRQFLETCKKYNRLNQETLICNRRRLLEDYRELLHCEFLEEEKTEQDQCRSDEEGNGRLVRKRTERRANQVPNPPRQTCIMEPWFRRHLKLNKFIWAARKIILRNRLLKVLEKLKTLTVEDVKLFEKRKRTFLNISYAEIFEKFL